MSSRPWLSSFTIRTCEVIDYEAMVYCPSAIWIGTCHIKLLKVKIKSATVSISFANARNSIRLETWSTHLMQTANRSNCTTWRRLRNGSQIKDTLNQSNCRFGWWTRTRGCCCFSVGWSLRDLFNLNLSYSITIFSFSTTLMTILITLKLETFFLLMTLLTQ